MKLTRYTYDPKNPPELDEEFERRMRTMTPEEIEQNALDDPDNPPMTEEELQRNLLARRMRRLRERLNMSQVEFAATYGFSLELLRSVESGSGRVEGAVISYIDVTIANPVDVASAVAAGREGR